MNEKSLYHHFLVTSFVVNDHINMNELIDSKSHRSTHKQSYLSSAATASQKSSHKIHLKMLKKARGLYAKAFK